MIDLIALMYTIIVYMCSMCCGCKVFFCIVISAFAIGTLAPNLEKIGTARGAAYMIWDLIDRVRVV